MKLRTLFGLLAGKLLIFVLTRGKIGGASALPGLVANKIDPNFVENIKVYAKVNIIVTGTNGKTTTSQAIAQAAKFDGLSIIRNHTGSNLEQGIASTLIKHFGWKLPDVGIWEIDEAAFNSIAPKLKPDIVIFLNAFRDQLDRYGEVDKIISLWQSALKALPSKTTVLFNADISALRALKPFTKGEVITFGIIGKKITGEKMVNAKRSGSIDYLASNITEIGLDSLNFDIYFRKKFQTKISLPVPGVYNIYNFLAAFIASQKLGIATKLIKQAFENFTPAFGRVEKFSLHKTLNANQTGYIFLIKNPTGANQVIATIKNRLTPDDRLLVALNDNIADGRDVSWVWDSNFEELTQTNFNQIIASGNRAQDLALRLKYAGINYVLTPKIDQAFMQALNGLKGNLFVLPTYTAMLKFQTILKNQGLKDHYWMQDS